MDEDNEKIKICFVGYRSSSFITRDYDILKKYFNINFIEPPKGKKEWLRYLSLMKKAVKESDITFGWFAGWHTAPMVHYSKRYGKRSIVVVGGYDAAYVPELNYGAFARIKEKIPAKYVLKNADMLLAVSKFTESEVLKRVRPKNIKVVYNGVDTEKFKPLGKKEKNLVITVGRIKWSNLKRKGIETFVESAKFVPEVHFVIIGKVLDDSIDYLKSILPPNVELAGSVSDKDLIELYRKAKVITQLSYYEAFGLAPGEGMACGCVPVVTKERSGMPEFVGDTGFYVPYGNKKSTAKAIKKAIDAPPALGKKARERIVENFSIEKREKNLIRIIEEEAVKSRKRR